MRNELLTRDWKDFVEICKTLVIGGSADLSDRQEELLESDGDLANIVACSASITAKMLDGAPLDEDDRALFEENTTVHELVRDTVSEIRRQ